MNIAIVDHLLFSLLLQDAGAKLHLLIKTRNKIWEYCRGVLLPVLGYLLCALAYWYWLFEPTALLRSAPAVLGFGQHIEAFLRAAGLTLAGLLANFLCALVVQTVRRQRA